jgi:nitrate reductase NapAB chaperone NapD
MVKTNNEVYAAIALALHEFKGNNVHDKETGKITIVKKTSLWNAHILTMTQHP